MDGVAHARAIYSADSPAHNKKTRECKEKEKRAQHGSARGSAPLLFSYYNKKMKIIKNKYFDFFGGKFKLRASFFFLYKFEIASNTQFLTTFDKSIDTKWI